MTGIKAASVKPVRVFISYSHDSPEHMEHVLAFANNLRAHGIDSVVDRYFEDTLNMRWADWMNQQIETADFVLVVATPSYSQRLKPADVGSPGAGANFEGAVITQHLYNLHGHNDKFFAIYFGDANRTSIPTVLEGFPNYDVSTDNGYTKLYRRLTNQPGFVPPPLGAVINPALLYSPPVPPPVASPHQQAAKDRVEELGRAYQNLRKSMPASNERTRKMEILAARMRALACDAYFLLEYLAKNPETGSRLAAVSLLETKPNPDYLEWLSERFAVEKPFVGYHAALALLVAARALGAEFRQRTKTAIDEANRLLGSGLETTDRAQTLDLAARELHETEEVVRQLSVSDQRVS